MQKEECLLIFLLVAAIWVIGDIGWTLGQREAHREIIEKGYGEWDLDRQFKWKEDE
jgi:hypothetical protein